MGLTIFEHGLLPSVVRKVTRFAHEKSCKSALSGKYLAIFSFHDGLAKVSLGADENYKKGYINMKGEEVIPAIYDEAESFENGKAKVKLGKKKFYIDTKGNETK